MCRRESKGELWAWNCELILSAYGVVPVYLSEISPVAFRATWPGVGE